MAISKLSKEILMDIETTITELRNSDLLRDENGIAQHPLQGKLLELTYNGKNDASKIMYDKHISCSQLMNSLLIERQYTVLLYDKSIIQAEFLIDENYVAKERLVFMKKHNRIWEKSEVEEYDAFDEDWFAEEAGIPILIRVDYDPQEHKECNHAAAHLTLSNHESCRIPVKNAVTFSEFVRFILFHFYSRNLAMPEYRLSGHETITEVEKKMVHMSWN